MSLEMIRKMIDDIDDEMRVLFERRMDCIKAVVEYKFNNDGKIFDKNREETVIESNLNKLENKDYAKAYERFLHEIMDSSKEYQKQWINNEKKEQEGKER